MQPESSSSRRQFLGAAAGTVVTLATAGCLDSLSGGSASATKIEPVEPSETPEGTPGEFYYFLEENGIEVDELLEDDSELFLTYHSDANSVEESDEEIRIIYEVYKQGLIERGSEIKFLYSEISNPFDEQARGWGINSEWIRQANSNDAAENASTGNESGDDNGTVDDETNGNETTGNETAGNEFDMGEVMIWSNIMNSKVYKEDLEDGNDENETESESNESGTDGDDSESEADDSTTE